jgi:hypothetical protein
MRALFIIVNIARIPPCGGPISSPSQASLSPNAITQVGEAWMPSLCSMETQRTSLSVPSLRILGTRNSEMPRVPGGASGRRASTRWTMLSAKSCSPNVM